MRTRAAYMSKIFTLVFLILTMGLEAPRPSNAASKNTKHVPLKKVADIPMPGPAVRFDYQSLDASRGRLYIAHMNADQLVIFDTKKREVVANLDGFSHVHGVWAVPELGRVYASVTGEHKVAAVDMKTLQTLARVGPINYPDGIAYAPAPQRVFVSDAHGNVDAVIDTKTNSLVASIPLGGGAGNTVYDSGSGHLFGCRSREERGCSYRSGNHADHWPLPYGRHSKPARNRIGSVGTARIRGRIV